MILKTFNSTSELSFHLHCTEKLKTVFPDGYIIQGMLSEVGWQSGIQSLLNVQRKIRIQYARYSWSPELCSYSILEFILCPAPC